MSWAFFDIWNQSLLERPERKNERRLNVWASEMGGSMIDRWLKMKGEPYTNPPNERSLRKFEAGNFWEALVGLVLFRSGLLVDEQVGLKFKYKDTLECSGKADFKAGGIPDWERAKSSLERDSTLQRMPFIARTAKMIIENFSQRYPHGLEPQILEVKSSSLFMFDKYEKYQACDPKHKLQAYHYLKADPEIKQANVVYICKDDSRMLEIGIVENPETEQVYYQDLKDITKFVEDDIEPPKEPEIVYMRDTNRFAANWKVEYSPYLTKLYGYKQAMEFREKYHGTNGSGGMLSKWNYTFTRYLKGAKMTENNLGIIKEIEDHGFIFKQLAEQAKAKEPQESLEDYES